MLIHTEMIPLYIDMPDCLLFSFAPSIILLCVALYTIGLFINEILFREHEH
jgi:hypothetical protein